MKHVLSAPAPDYSYISKLIWVVALVAGFGTQFSAVLVRNLPPLHLALDFLLATTKFDYEQEPPMAPIRSIAKISLSLQSICFVLLPIYTVLVFAFSGLASLGSCQSLPVPPSSFSCSFSMGTSAGKYEEEPELEKPIEHKRKNKTIKGSKNSSKSRKDSKEGIEYLQTNYSDESFYSPTDNHPYVADNEVPVHHFTIQRATDKPLDTTHIGNIVQMLILILCLIIVYRDHEYDMKELIAYLATFLFSKNLQFVSEHFADIYKDRGKLRCAACVVTAISDSACITISYKLLIDSIHG